MRGKHSFTIRQTIYSIQQVQAIFFQKVDSFYAIAQPLQIKNLSVYSNVRKETQFSRILITSQHSPNSSSCNTSPSHPVLFSPKMIRQFHPVQFSVFMCMLQFDNVMTGIPRNTTFFRPRENLWLEKCYCDNQMKCVLPPHIFMD